nr:uncharacterized mitochondrial protein AtMg00810-like [Tanacetum cinerariifolium]
MIFRYLRGTINTDLWYTKDSGFELTGFSDADYAGCKDTFKSTSGEAQFLGEKLVSWSSKKQDCMALSIAKAEYVSLSAFSRTGGIYPGTLPIDRVEVLVSNGNPSRVNIKQLYGRGSDTLSWKPYQGGSSKIEPTLSQIRRWRYNLTPAELKFKTPMLDHQDKNMMKAQVHMSKSSAISYVQPLPLRKHYCQIYQVVKHMLREILLASFQDLEHEGGDTRSQDDIKDNDVEFNFDEITFNTNNEVALLYPPHPNLEYFKAVSDFISKYFQKEAFTRASNQYKEYLSKLWNAIRANYLSCSIMYVNTPSLATIRPWFSSIGYSREIRAKGTLKNSCFPPRQWRYNLSPAESKFKTPMLDHQDKYMMKAQVHVSKSSVISDEQPLPRKKLYRQHVKANI